MPQQVGVGASAFTFHMSSFPDSHIVSKENWVDGESASCSVGAWETAAVREQCCAHVAALAVSEPEGGFHPQLQSEGCRRVSLCKRWKTMLEGPAATGKSLKT